MRVMSYPARHELDAVADATIAFCDLPDDKTDGIIALRSLRITFRCQLHNRTAIILPCKGGRR